MAFWSSGKTEPKRNYRFKVLLAGFEQDNVLWWAKSVTVPSYDVSEVEHNFFDNKYYYPGRVSWSEISLVLVDPISPDAVQLTNKLLIDSGYNIPQQAQGANQKRTISKRRATNTGFKSLDIEVVNAEGKTIEKWEVKNPFIKSAKYGDLAYDNDDLRTVEMSIRYDWAVCTTGQETGGDVKQFEAYGGTTPPSLPSPKSTGQYDPS